jgi:uncharacterized repeat protein (TIGR04076 family)
MRELKITVKKIKERCGAKHRVGDYFLIKGKGKIVIPEGKEFCVYALQALLPFLMLIQREPSPDDEWVPQIHELSCPDEKGLIFEIKVL